MSASLVARIFATTVVAIVVTSPISAGGASSQEPPNTPVVVSDTLHWNPQLYRQTLVYDEYIDGAWQLFVMKLGKRQATQITSVGTVNPHEKRIYGNNVVYQVPSGDESQIYLYDIQKRTTRQLSQGPGYFAGPDIWANTVVFSDNNNGGTNDIVAYDLKSGTTTRITSSPSDERSPSISAHWITFTTEGNTNHPDIAAYNRKTGQISTVSDAEGAQDHSRVSDDLVVWDDHRRGTDFLDVYMFDLRKGNEALVSDGQDVDGRPAISGKRVVYTDFSSTQGDVIYYNVARRQTIRVTSDPATQSQPAIFGKRIVWMDYRGGPPAIYTTSVR